MNQMLPIKNISLFNLHYQLNMLICATLSL